MTFQHPANDAPPPKIPEIREPQSPSSDSWDDESVDTASEGEAADKQATISPKNSHDVPAALRPGGGFVHVADEDTVWDEARKQPNDTTPQEEKKLDQVPDALKPGGSRAETNPFLRNKMATHTQPPNTAQLPQFPTDTFSRMDLTEPSTNPWQPATDTQNERTTLAQSPSHPPPPPPPTQPSLLDEADSDAWATNPVELPAQQPAAKSPTLMSLASDDGSGWDESPRHQDSKSPAAPPATVMSHELIDDQHVWDDLGMLDRGKGKSTLPAEQMAQGDEWNLIDADPLSSSSKQPANELTNEKSTQAAGKAMDEDRPPLPPRQDGTPARWVPSREPVDSRSETYQVKNIRWHDAASAKNPRTSPILIQNLNGPCPLVALVNALTLTTAADITDTALVETLRSREQVSLSLLLDAVLDELMSPRRTSSEDALPDVSDLYAFLQSLHTGMNVNPRFVPTPQMVNAYKRTSLTHLHPTERGNLIPGTFENTLEMGLYATFSIPLIHGWLPPRDEPVYEALERQAASYEDVQNLLFREEELEDKLSNSNEGLTEEEQQLYEDIISIKLFLNASATQLTAWGIEVIGKAIRPGTFAILFRNDHFSTLYCHPQTMQLMTLVTDDGYRSHDEVVWETLVDVNGERTEFLSGDYRLVGSGTEAGPTNVNAGSSSADRGGDWTTVPTNKHGKSKQAEEDVPMTPSHEQEDRDLALALQLQEEEEHKQREDEERRRRESRLSEQYIEQQGQQPVPVNRNASRDSTQGATDGYPGAGRGGQVIPPNQSPQTGRSRNIQGIAPRRQSSAAGGPEASSAGRGASLLPARQPATQEVRPLVPPRRLVTSRPAATGEEPPPPTYEEAAHDAAYVPPMGHPSHATSSLDVSRQPSRTSVSTAASGPPTAMGPGRRPPGYPGAGMGSAAAGGQRDNRDCVVM